MKWDGFRPGLFRECVLAGTSGSTQGHTAVPGRHLLGILLQFSSLSEGPGGWEGIPVCRAPERFIKDTMPTPHTWTGWGQQNAWF